MADFWYGGSRITEEPWISHWTTNMINHQLILHFCYASSCLALGGYMSLLSLCLSHRHEYLFVCVVVFGTHRLELWCCSNLIKPTPLLLLQLEWEDAVGGRSCRTMQQTDHPCCAVLLRGWSNVIVTVAALIEKNQTIWRHVVKSNSPSHIHLDSVERCLIVVAREDNPVIRKEQESPIKGNWHHF